MFDWDISSYWHSISSAIFLRIFRGHCISWSELVFIFAKFIFSVQILTTVFSVSNSHMLSFTLLLWYSPLRATDNHWPCEWCEWLKWNKHSMNSWMKKKSNSFSAVSRGTEPRINRISSLPRHIWGTISEYLIISTNCFYRVSYFT